MSRRPGQSADSAARNAQTLKTLVKIESNKTCADCKRNKHPRWASWNLGIFICIRCSGIHRGMGTHISRVKSVDLDSWTDEQTASMIKWGNTRANKYWEAKLAPGHVPAEAKIENFIRTKYDTKRWSMEGPIPDPSTLDDGEEDTVPSAVQEQPKAALPPRVTTTASGQVAPPPSNRRAVNIDLFGDDPSSVPVSAPAPPRAASAAPVSTRPPPPPPKADPTPPKLKPADSLLGFDFFGTTQAPPSRPQSAAPNISGGGQSRPDLKQSILSLYSKPAPVAASQPSANPTSPAGQQSSNFGSMNDAFGGLNFGGGAPVTKPGAFSNLASPPPQQQQRSGPNATMNPQQSSALGGGSFFDTKPAPKPAQTTTATSRPAYTSASSGYGDFASAANPGWGAPAPAQTSSTNGMNDLFDFSAPAPAKAAPVAQSSSVSHMDSPFNISTTSKPAQSVHLAASGRNNMGSSISMDPWGGSSNAWASPATATTTARAPVAAQVPVPRAQPTISAASDGWGDFTSSTGTAQVTADEDFGGWESSTAPAPVPAPAAGPATTQSTFTSAAAFDNPWE